MKLLYETLIIWLCLHVISCYPKILNYDKINNEIQQLVEKFKIPASWNDLEMEMKWNMAKDIAKEKIQNVIIPELIEKKLFFSKSIRFIHFVDDLKVDVSDIQRIFRAYKQITDSGSEYILVHFISSYLPYQSRLTIQNINTLNELLSPQQYIQLNFNDFDDFKSSLLRNSSINIEIYDKNSILRKDILLLLLKHKLLGSNLKSIKNEENYSLNSFIEKFSQYFRWKHNQSSFNHIDQTWMFDVKVEWIGQLPMIMHRLDSQTGDYLGLQQIGRNTMNNPDTWKLFDHKYIQEIIHSFLNQTKQQNVSIYDYLSALWINYQLTGKLNNQFDKFNDKIGRYSDKLIELLIEQLSNTTNVCENDENLALCTIQQYNLRYRDILPMCLSDSLLGNDFQDEDNVHYPKLNCSTETIKDYDDRLSEFLSHDLDGLEFNPGTLYLNIGNCKFKDNF